MIPPQVQLIWPNNPYISIEEGKTYYIKFIGEAQNGIKNADAEFSHDGGQTWTDLPFEKYYYHYPTYIRDSLRWNVTQSPTRNGRIKAILTDTNGIKAYDISDYDFVLKPATPTGISAPIVEIDICSNVKIIISWNDNSQYEDSYILEYKMDNMD